MKDNFHFLMASDQLICCFGLGMCCTIHILQESNHFILKQQHTPGICMFSFPVFFQSSVLELEDIFGPAPVISTHASADPWEIPGGTNPQSVDIAFSPPALSLPSSWEPNSKKLCYFSQFSHFFFFSSFPSCTQLAWTEEQMQWWSFTKFSLLHSISYGYSCLVG